jgi:Domain of unknown function (DUF397)
MDEAGTAGTWWRKSSYSGGDNNCVEVGATRAGIAVRDSKNPDSDALTFGAGAWQSFTQKLYSGRNSTAS